MPHYSFRCEKCGSCFTEIRRLKDFSRTANCSCGGTGNLFIEQPPGLVFTDPRGTSKWDNFGYRAGFNMEKAKGERRAAEAAEKHGNPYKDIEDFDRRGVFDKGGIDNEEMPGLTHT